TVGFTILLALSFIGVAIPNGIVWAMVSDVIDYGQWRTRKRREGITYSMFNFSRKIAQSIAGGLAGFGLSLVGYVANAAQTPGTLLGIKALQTLYPCIAFLIAAAVLLLLYKLTDARQAEIVGELRASEQVAEVSGEIEGEIDPHALRVGAATAPTPDRPDGDRPDGTTPTGG
ncbi:MAG TPA: MFS transporter, partial [Pseudonocardia sp.]